MKLKFFIVLLIVLLGSLLASCSFVSYNKYPEPLSEKTLLYIEEKSEYFDSLYAPDLYFDEDAERLKLLIQDAKNELNESSSQKEAEEVYEKHLKLITAVPNAIESYVESVSSFIDFDLYREAEKQALYERQQHYLSQAYEEKSPSELIVLYNYFQTEVSTYKTDKNYYEEELDVLISSYKEQMLNIDFSLYRTKEYDILKNIIDEFFNQIDSSSIKEEAKNFFDTYKDKLDQVKKDEELSTLERANSLAEWTTLFNNFIEDFNVLDDSEIKNKLESVENLSAREINTECSLYYLKLLTDHNASLTEFKVCAEIYLNSCYDPLLYRKEQKENLDNFIINAKLSLQEASETNNISTLIETVKATIADTKTNDELWQEEDAAFATLIADTYGTNVLEAPVSLTEANNYLELASIIDYYAFYQTSYTSFLRNTFRVKLLFPIKYSQWEINEVYWYCELLRSAVGITGYFEENSNNLVITLIPYALATNTNAESPVIAERFNNLLEIKEEQNQTFTNRSLEFDNFPYTTKYTKKLNGVWNTQQLWYALEHEYLPIVVKDSPAENALERAKEILRQIIKEGMTDDQKVFAIFNWFASNISYDHGYSKYLYPEDRDLFPDKFAATLNSFQLEGALFDNLAVCCSYAKTYLLLLRMEGIESYRITLHKYKNNAIGNNGASGYGSHALVAVKLSDGKYYYSDVEESISSIDSHHVRMHQFAVTDDLDFSYEDAYTRLFPNITINDSLSTVITEKLSYKGQSVYIKNLVQLEDILSKFNQESKRNIQISLFDNGDADFSILDILFFNQNIEVETFSYKGFIEYILYK